jgi:hypothetical protein
MGYMAVRVSFETALQTINDIRISLVAFRVKRYTGPGGAVLLALDRGAIHLSSFCASRWREACDNLRGSVGQSYS